MAGSVKGLLVEIGGDTSGLQKALSKVNTVTKGLSKELKGINTLLKLDPKNTELLAQKQTVLKQNIQQTTEKLKQLKAAQDLYIKSGGDLNSEQYRNLQREIISTQNKLKEFKLEASNWTKVSQGLKTFSTKLESIGTTISKLGQSLTTKVTIPIITLGTLFSKSAIEFETAFTGVEKTVDGTAEQMQNIKDGIKNMSKIMPATTTEISAVAEAAGQLGIKTEDILDFTKVMIDLGESTNLSSDEAASSLAKFANIVNMNSKDYQKIGSVIVDLGNNFATTERDIVEMATRLASTGELTGLTESQIMGLATAISSVGIEAEAGGSAMSKLLQKMATAVETGKSGKVSLDKLAKVAGMTSDEFIQSFKKDSAGALASFIDGLNNTERNGKGAISVLQDLGLTDVRMTNTILSLANAHGLMSNAIRTADIAWNENNALTKEAQKRYETLESKMAMMKNQLNNVGITLGEILMPYIEKFVNFISKITEKLNELSPETKEIIVKVAMIVAAIGPALLILGKVITTISTIAGALSKVAEWIGLTSVGAEGLSGVIAAATNPITLVIAAIAAATAALIYLYNTNDKIKASINEIVQEYLKRVQKLIEFLRPYIKSAIDWFVEFWDTNVKDTLENLRMLLEEFFEAAKQVYINFIFPIVDNLMKKLAPAFDIVFKNIGAIVEFVLKNIITSINTVIGVFRGLIEFLTGVFTGDWQKAWSGIKGIFGSIFNGLGSMVRNALNAVIKVINNGLARIGEIKIPDWVPIYGGRSFYMPRIPQLAKGGIVNSPTLSLIGEGKSAEAVIPLDKTLTKYMAKAIKEAGGSNNTINVNFYPQKMNEAELNNAVNYINRRFGLAF